VVLWISRIASMVGDPARAAMLEALMDGARAFNTTESSRAACIATQTASSHLGQLTIGLVEVDKQGGPATAGSRPQGSRR
jgi:hypothetical protein